MAGGAGRSERILQEARARLLIILKQGLCLNRKHVILSTLPGLGIPACLCPPILELQTHAAMTGFLFKFQGVNSCLRGHILKLAEQVFLLTEPPAQPFMMEFGFQSQYSVHLEVLREAEAKCEIFIFTKQT